jgi:hypothetical protein
MRPARSPRGAVELARYARLGLALARPVAALKPGGWLVGEDFDSSLPHCLNPATGEEQAFVKAGQALVGALHRRVADTTYPAPSRTATAAQRWPTSAPADIR